MFIVAVAVYQGSSIMNPYWQVVPVRFPRLLINPRGRLVLWQKDSLGLSKGAYVSLPLFMGLPRIDQPPWPW